MRLLCFALVYLVWGSTYGAIAIALRELPPLLLAGSRFLVAGLVLSVVATLRGESRLDPASRRRATVSGVLLFVFGNGMVCVAEQWVPTGTVALLMATGPLWFVLLEWRLHRAPTPAPGVFVGVALGMVGVLVLVGPTGETPGGVLLVLGAAFCWAAGALHGKHRVRGPMMRVAAQQLLGGGATLVALGLVLGERVSAPPSAGPLLAWIYLTLVASVVTYAAYQWLLRSGAAVRVATHAFVNPLVAVAVGALAFGEALPLRVLLSAAFVLVAVLLVLRPLPGRLKVPKTRCA